MDKTEKKIDVEKWLDDIEPDATPVRDGRYLRAIGAALTAIEEADKELTRSIDAARAAGDSWEAIGLVLGTSRQAAHRKYARQLATSLPEASRGGSAGGPDK